MFVGMRKPGEVAATWLGFFAGVFLWTGWVEFAFVWAKNFLGVPDLMDTHAPGEIATEIAAGDLERDRPRGESTNRPTVEVAPREIAQDGLKEILKEGGKTPNVVIEETGKPLPKTR